MVTRSFGSFCSLLVAWLCALGALGATPALRPVGQSLVARGGVELALRDVAEAPLLGARASARRAAVARVAERNAAPAFSWFAAGGVPSLRETAHATRMMLVRQEAAHTSRARWRAYDAAAPPALSRTAR